MAFGCAFLLLFLISGVSWLLYLYFLMNNHIDQSERFNTDKHLRFNYKITGLSISIYLFATLLAFTLLEVTNHKIKNINLNSTQNFEELLKHIDRIYDVPTAFLIFDNYEYRQKGLERVKKYIVLQTDNLISEIRVPEKKRRKKIDTNEEDIMVILEHLDKNITDKDSNNIRNKLWQNISKNNISLNYNIQANFDKGNVDFNYSSIEHIEQKLKNIGKQIGVQMTKSYFKYTINIVFSETLHANWRDEQSNRKFSSYGLKIRLELFDVAALSNPIFMVTTKVNPIKGSFRRVYYSPEDRPESAVPFFIDDGEYEFIYFSPVLATLVKVNKGTYDISYLIDEALLRTYDYYIDENQYPEEIGNLIFARINSALKLKNERQFLSFLYFLIEQIIERDTIAYKLLMEFFMLHLGEREYNQNPMIQENIKTIKLLENLL